MEGYKVFKLKTTSTVSNNNNIVFDINNSYGEHILKTEKVLKTIEQPYLFLQPIENSVSI